MRSQEFTGKTTEEALQAGLEALGVTLSDVKWEVLQEGAKGLFGLFGSKPARVRITVMEEEKEDDHGLSDLLGSFSLGGETQRKKSTPKPAEKKGGAPKAEVKTEKKADDHAPKAEMKPEKKADEPAPKTIKPAKAEKETREAEPSIQQETAPAAEKRAERPARPPRERKPRPPKPPREKAERAEQEPREYAPMAPAEPFIPTEPPVIHDENTPAGRAQRFLMDVTERMNVKVDVYVDASHEDSLYIHMIGDTLGILIGRRGETLDALQYLTSLQVNKGREGYIRVTLDTENYRAKREDSLRRLAQRMANRAQKTGRKVVLEPMNPYERRVLHTALQNHPAVTTHSEGEEPNRRVVIMLKNQPERPEQGVGQERAEKGDKPSSSRRGRNRRRGRRWPRPEGAAPQSAVQEPAQETPTAPEKPATGDVLGEEE